MGYLGCFDWLAGVTTSVLSSEIILSPIPAGAIRRASSLPLKLTFAFFGSLAMHLAIVLALCFVPKSLLAPNVVSEANFDVVTVDVTYRSSSGLSAPASILSSVTASSVDAELETAAVTNLAIESVKLEPKVASDAGTTDRDRPAREVPQREFIERKSSNRRPPPNALPSLNAQPEPSRRRQSSIVSIAPKTAIDELDRDGGKRVGRAQTLRDTIPLLSQVNQFEVFGRATMGDDPTNHRDSTGDDSLGARRVDLQSQPVDKVEATDTEEASESVEKGNDVTPNTSGEEAVLALAARVTHRVDPYFPGDWAAQGIFGDVLMNVHVSKTGQVTKVDVVKTSGHDRLDQSAVAAIKQWRYRPAEQAGKPIAYQGKQLIQFFAQ